MFRKLVSKLSRGQEIGTLQGGLACLGEGKLFWKRGGRVPLGDEELSVHPGSSGGPLLDGEGRVVGLARSGYAFAGRVGVGLNDFVPIEEVWRALNLEPKRTPVTLTDLLAGKP